MSRIEDAKQKRISDLLIQYSIPFKKAGANEIKIVCPAADHADKDASCMINTDKNLFQCLGCGKAGSAIDFVMMVEGCSLKRAISILVGEEDHSEPKKKVVKSVPKKEFNPAPEHKTKQYDYCNVLGKKLYASVRYDYPDGSKEFRMATFNGNTPILGLKGDIERVPYMLDEFEFQNEIWWAEGEKCAEALTEFGIFCTCIAGGSKAKTDDVIKHFAGKNVVLLPDNDDTGREFMLSISEKLSDVAASIKTLDVGTVRNQKGYDIYDKIQDLKADGLDNHEVRDRLILMKRAAFYDLDGVPVPILNSDQREAEYQLMLLMDGFDLGDYIPDLKNIIRPLIPGDCLGIVGGTGSGKTAMLQAIAEWAAPMTVLVFNIELSTGVFFEREVSGATEIPAADIEKMYKAGNKPSTGNQLTHIYTVPLSKVTPDEIRRQFHNFVKLKKIWPDFAVVDYVQLLKGTGPRYERTTDNAEEVRILGKELCTRMVFTSQKSRASLKPHKEGEDIKPTLNDAKDSGGLENSMSVYMDLRPHPKHPDLKIGTILKNTRGPAGIEFNIGWNGACTKFIAGPLEQPDDIDTSIPPPPDHTEAHHDEDAEVPF